MDPLSALVVASLVTWLWAKNVAQDAAFAIRGEEPPSARRERERWERRQEERAAKGIEPERREARNFFGNAWADAWATREELRARAAERKRQERREEWAQRDEADRIEDEAYEANRDRDREQAEQQPMRCEMCGVGHRASELALVAVEGRPTWACSGCAKAARDAYPRSPKSGTETEPPSNGPRPTQAGADLEHEIKQKVVQEFADDNVTEDEIVLKDNGDIVIDRRSTVPWAQPTVVGRWRDPRPDDGAGDEGTGSWQKPAPTDSAAESDRLRHAAELVIATRFASPSMVQRKLRLTYDEAADLIDRLERRGVIGPADPQTGERAWFADLDQLDDLLRRPDPTARGEQTGDTEEEEAKEGDGNGTVIPFAPRMDPADNPAPIPAAQEDQVSGETPNLQAAIAYNDGMAGTCQQGVVSTEQSVANCQAGGVTNGRALAAMVAGQEALAVAAGHFETAAEHFREHLGVTEAYAANQDAGDKQFVTQD